VLASKIVGSGVVATEDAIAFVVDQGARGMAIKVEEVVSYGGLALPGDHVDIYWMPGNEAKVVQDHEGAVLIADNVEVLAVQQTLVGIGPSSASVEGDTTAGDAQTTTGAERVRDGSAQAQPGAITVTLLLNPTQAARVFCSDASGSLRLAVRGFGDETPNGQPQGKCIIPADENLADQQNQEP
jgi:Flp pilus assembly protein CpaB